MGMMDKFRSFMGMPDEDDEDDYDYEYEEDQQDEREDRASRAGKRAAARETVPASEPLNVLTMPRRLPITSMPSAQWFSISNRPTRTSPGGWLIFSAVWLMPTMDRSSGWQTVPLSSPPIMSILSGT